MNEDSRTPDEIQRDIDREREQLSDTLNSLNQNLSFDGIRERVSDQLRGVSSDFLDDFAGTLIKRAREKPIAAGLVLAGLTWMAIGTPSRRDARPIAPTEPKSQNAQEKYGHQSSSELNQTPAPLSQSVLSAANNRIEKLSADAKTLRDRITDGTENLSEESRERVIQARRAAAEAAETAIDTLRSGARKTKHAVQDNPFAVGGIALAVGAGVGGVMLLRKQENDARDARNELFREADRIMTEEALRIAATDHSVGGGPTSE